MSEIIKIRKREVSPYRSAITEEEFLFYEMRVVAELVVEGYSDEDVVELIVDNDLFSYKTEEAIRKMAEVCLECLHGLPDKSLEAALANQPFDVARQIALYAMMRRYRLIWDFMVTVIGEKYRREDLDFDSSDLKEFFHRVQERDEAGAWDDFTIGRGSQILMRLLVENEYLEDLKSDRLESVWLYPLLEQAIRKAGDAEILPAFNCFNDKERWF